jgi:short-subunit dehydrogenase
MEMSAMNDTNADSPSGDSYEGQLAVVTGASSGIGLELAKQFASHGFDLLIISEDDQIDAAAEHLRSLGARVDAVQANLATFDGVESVCQLISDNGQPIDALALNAGVGVGGPFLESELDDELNLIALNVASPVHMAKRLLPAMVARDRGRVLITSSIAAEMPAPFEATYGASKAFLLSFSEALRNELKDTHVTVTALQPGPTDTNFFRRAGMEDTKVGAGKKDDPADVARDGFEAMMAGKDHIVAGSLKNKIQSAVAQILPETTKAEMHRKVGEPGSARS